jgi:uncharacterized protein YfiM (DUF2279 family)
VRYAGGQFEHGSVDITSGAPRLRHSKIVHGKEFGVRLDAGSPVFEDTEISDHRKYGVALIFAGSTCTLSGCLIADNALAGIFGNKGTILALSSSTVRNNRENGIEMDGHQLTLNGNVFDSNLGAGLLLRFGGLPRIENNIFRDTKKGPSLGAPVAMEWQNMGAQWMGNVFEGTNALNAIYVTPSSMDDDMVIKPAPIPYYIQDVIDVPSGRTVQIEPGVIIKLRKGQLGISGRMMSRGTSGAPVVFTSLADDSVGGDSNGDGAATQPQPEDWGAINLTGTGASQLEHTHFYYGGRRMVTLSNSNALFRNCVFQYAREAGVYVAAPGATPRFEFCSFENQSYGIASENSSVVIATSCWWGHPTGPHDASDDRASGGWYNPAGQGVEVTDRVSYVPWRQKMGGVLPQVTGVTVRPPVDGRTVTVQWSVVPEASGYDVSFSTDGLSFVSIGVFASAEGIHRPPAGPAQFYYVVQAMNDVGDKGPASAPAVLASPFRPVINFPLNGARLSTGTVVISGNAQVGTRVYIVSLTGVVLGTATASIDGAFSITRLFAEGEQRVHARAIDGFGRLSSFSSTTTFVVELPLEPPLVPVATPGDTVVMLTWPASHVLNLAGYWLYRDGASKPINKQLLSAAGAREFKDIGLTNGREYQYRLAVQTTAGVVSPLSAPVSAKPVAGTGW